MAQIVKSTPHLPPTTSSNGGVIAPNTRGVVGGNRKKQKRRAKLAARQAEQGLVEPNQTAEISARNGQVPQGESTISYHQPSDAQAEYDDPDYDDPNNFDPQERLDEYYSEDEEDAYRNDYASPNGAYAGAPEPSTSRRKNKKKRRSTQGRSQSYNGHGLDDFSAVRSPPPPPMSAAALRSVQRSAKQDRIWNTSTQEERERIKEFWLQLSEEERKSLLKIEKEAVLRKMKEQQKHACSCTVCGRKRTAIEEELEVLYDAYYEELEQYANHQHPGEPGDSIIPPPRGFPQPTNHMRPNSAVPLPLSTGNPQHRTSRVHEILDEGEAEFSDEEDEYSDEEDDDEDDDELYSDEEEPDEEIPVNMGVDFFNFGNSLTVKGRSCLQETVAYWFGRLNSDSGGILTVADDLLKNDGKKFIEMMEQLAERRMRREQEAEYAASQPSHGYANGGHELEDDEYDEDEEEYDSQDEYDDEEEEDEMVPSDHMPSGTVSQANHSQSGLTEDDRMREGRRMFQIFAARMFEQRVLTAYREKVAAERQQKLLEELEDESRLDAQREAKKARDAEKKKSKKLAQKQAKAEEKAKREAEKAAEEAAAKAAEEKKLEEQRRKKEEQRKKKEAERKAQEEERQRKEAERLKRQNEEKERQQEAERKAREQKAQEKRQREEARKKNSRKSRYGRKKLERRKSRRKKRRSKGMPKRKRKRRPWNAKKGAATTSSTSSNRQAPVTSWNGGSTSWIASKAEFFEFFLSTCVSRDTRATKGTDSCQAKTGLTTAFPWHLSQNS
ncbi:Stress response protein nst1 [Taxawa tesnikishii (nom. ined.)]|nr:Stress response protein nst1 [Dothideales sp. JES 119]